MISLSHHDATGRLETLERETRDFHIYTHIYIYIFTVYIHLLIPNLDTSSVMFLGSLDVSGLSTSYALLQVTHTYTGLSQKIRIL